MTVKTGSWKLPLPVSVMTIFAFELLYFIEDISFALLSDHFMTFIASYIYMFPIEREQRFTVIETRCRDKG